MNYGRTMDKMHRNVFNNGNMLYSNKDFCLEEEKS